MRDLYLNMELRQDLVAKIFGVSNWKMRKILRKMGIKRTLSEATKLSWEHGTKKYNYKAMEQYRKRLREERMGKRVKTGRGYILVFVGENGRYGRNYDYEHILVWEKHNGRKLPKNWVIHHLNGIRDDNRIENLIALPRKKHETWTLIKYYQNRIRQLEKECA